MAPMHQNLRQSQQANYTNVVFATEESTVTEAFEEECWQGAKHQRLRREAQQERAWPNMPK